MNKQIQLKDVIFVDREYSHNHPHILHRHTEYKPNPVRKKRKHLVYRILDYLSEHYAEPLTLNLISEKFFISPSHLSHDFKKRNRRIADAIRITTANQRDAEFCLSKRRRLFKTLKSDLRFSDNFPSV